jgi:hypothetical protein
MKPTPEEQAQMQAEVERKRREEMQNAAAEKARGRNLGGALDIFKRKDTPIKKARGGAVKYKAGGYVKAADGIAKKGKTKGKMV